MDSRGASDAAYIRRVIDVQRKLELGSRVVLLASVFPPAWVLGTLGLSAAKILDNMEIGHNVLHGQWDWMRDPKIHSTTWDWDHPSPPEQWQKAHNQTHHTYTNIIGQDNDLGYGIMRVDEDQPWQPRYLVQPLWNFVNACIFEYGIAMYDLDLGDALREKKGFSPEMKRNISATLAKVRKQVTKDYVVHPALSLATGSFLTTLAANATANLVRNVWSHSIIMCGHFPEGVETFEQPALDPARDQGAVVPAPDAGLREHLGQQVHAPDVRQPLAPDRAPPLPRPAQQPVLRDVPAGAGALRALRADLQRPPAARSRWPARGTGCCGSRCPTAGWPRPTVATWSPAAPAGAHGALG